MISGLRFIHHIGIIAFLGMAIILTGCGNDPNATTDGSGHFGSGTAAAGSKQDFVANVGDRIFFDTDSVELTDKSRDTLDKQARWLNQYGHYAITVEGHADERGTREYNFALGNTRAERTKEYLISKGVSGSRIKTISYGKERPVAVCDDISCWSQNRRAVTLLGGGNS